MVVSMDCGRLPLNNRKRSNYSINQGHILIFFKRGSLQPTSWGGGCQIKKIKMKKVNNFKNWKSWYPSSYRCIVPDILYRSINIPFYMHDIQLVRIYMRQMLLAVSSSNIWKTTCCHNLTASLSYNVRGEWWWWWRCSFEKVTLWFVSI